MESICWLINNKTEYEAIASCCGHGKYPISIVVDNKRGEILEYFSQIIIPRKRNFYKKDRQGVFYIPEVIEKIKKKPKRREPKTLSPIRKGRQIFHK